MGDRPYFAACSKGLEPALEGELRELGALDIEVRRGGVAFRGDRRLGYAACLWLRSAIRVQEELLRAQVHDADDLYDAVADIDWNEWIAPDQTLAIYSSVRDAPSMRHSGFVTLKAKDAIVDVVRARHGARPSIDRKTPDLPLKLVLQGTRLLLYRDYAGKSLHKRGYRPVQVKSPLNEATAAGLLLLSDWDRASPLVDPMCGSGTLPIEAALLATDRAPGLSRAFPFERWPDFDEALWTALLDDAKARARHSLDFPIQGSDRHRGAIDLAKRGAWEANVDGLVDFTVGDARSFEPAAPPAVVVCNPPYGERLGEDGDLEDSWVALGNFLHRRCAGATAWVLSGNKALTRYLGLRVSRRVPVMNGPIDCRWLRYEIRART